MSNEYYYKKYLKYKEKYLELKQNGGDTPSSFCTKSLLSNYGRKLKEFILVGPKSDVLEKIYQEYSVGGTVLSLEKIKHLIEKYKDHQFCIVEVNPGLFLDSMFWWFNKKSGCVDEGDVEAYVRYLLTNKFKETIDEYEIKKFLRGITGLNKIKVDVTDNGSHVFYLVSRIYNSSIRTKNHEDVTILDGTMISTLSFMLVNKSTYNKPYEKPQKPKKLKNSKLPNQPILGF